MPQQSTTQTSANKHQIVSSVLARFGHTEPAQSAQPVYESWTEWKQGYQFRRLNQTTAVVVRTDPYNPSILTAWKIHLPTLKGIGRCESYVTSVEDAWAKFNPPVVVEHPLEIAAKASRWTECASLLTELGSDRALGLARLCIDMADMDAKYGRNSTVLTYERSQTKTFVLEFVSDQKEGKV